MIKDADLACHEQSVKGRSVSIDCWLMGWHSSRTQPGQIILPTGNSQAYLGLPPTACWSGGEDLCPGASAAALLARFLCMGSLPSAQHQPQFSYMILPLAHTYCHEAAGSCTVVSCCGMSGWICGWTGNFITVLGHPSQQASKQSHANQSLRKAWSGRRPHVASRLPVLPFEVLTEASGLELSSSSSSTTRLRLRCGAGVVLSRIGFRGHTPTRCGIASVCGVASVLCVVAGLPRWLLTAAGCLTVEGAAVLGWG